MSALADEEWRPGSFTKNFSWGEQSQGLSKLHEMIRIGFDDKLEDVPRSVFTNRVQNAGRPHYVALNFFLYNKVVGRRDYVAVDELVFQAITSEYSKRFDRLALFCFNFSRVGRWHGAESYQERPALWALHYVIDRVALEFGWDTSKISANDIEQFVGSDKRYTGKTTRKLATNLNYLYLVGDLRSFASTKVERWWVDSLFLALDRLIEDQNARGRSVSEGSYRELLATSEFGALTGKQSLEKSLATGHLADLYIACGGKDRFSDDFVRDRTALLLPDVAWLMANDPRPQGALHPTNPAILKTIPAACAMLAKSVGFEVIGADELEMFDPVDFVRRHTRQALDYLKSRGIKPRMSAEELRKITRDK
jgi:hypothetical protein